MPTQSPHAKPNPRTSKPRDIFPVKSLSISDSHPGLAEITGRHVAKLQDFKEGVVAPSIFYSNKSTVPYV